MGMDIHDNKTWNKLAKLIRSTYDNPKPFVKVYIDEEGFFELTLVADSHSEHIICNLFDYKRLQK